jgi:hypothetical protein
LSNRSRNVRTWARAQNLSRRREQDAKLVGPKAGATGVIDFQVVQLTE